jgi:hypothetical protein
MDLTLIVCKYCSSICGIRDRSDHCLLSGHTYCCILSWSSVKIASVHDGYEFCLCMDCFVWYEDVNSFYSRVVNIALLCGHYEQYDRGIWHILLKSHPQCVMIMVIFTIMSSSPCCAVCIAVAIAVAVLYPCPRLMTMRTEGWPWLSIVLRQQ